MSSSRIDHMLYNRHSIDIKRKSNTSRKLHGCSNFGVITLHGSKRHRGQVPRWIRQAIFSLSYESMQVAYARSESMQTLTKIRTKEYKSGRVIQPQMRRPNRTHTVSIGDAGVLLTPNDRVTIRIPRDLLPLPNLPRASQAKTKTQISPHSWIQPQPKLSPAAEGKANWTWAGGSGQWRLHSPWAPGPRPTRRTAGTRARRVRAPAWAATRTWSRSTSASPTAAAAAGGGADPSAPPPPMRVPPSAAATLAATPLPVRSEI